MDVKKRLPFILCLVELFFILSGCSTKKPKTAHERAEIYDKWARSYEAIADTQLNGAPYSSPAFGVGAMGTHEQNLRAIYLQEARRYRRLAEKTKLEAEQEEKDN